MSRAGMAVAADKRFANLELVSNQVPDQDSSGIESLLQANGAIRALWPRVSSCVSVYDTDDQPAAFPEANGCGLSSFCWLPLWTTWHH